MRTIASYAAHTVKAPLAPFQAPRRGVRPTDVEIQIQYCGICHSDLHQARDEWGGATFPMVPGHEIVGTVSKVGAQVTRFAVGDTVGVGCMVDSCRSCPSCKEGLEQYCEVGGSYTYNSTEQDRVTPTYGGYSKLTVVDEAFVLHVSPKLQLSAVAPLLCAGITTYSPLRHWQVGPGTKLAVMGLGGLGHMAVKIAAGLGAEVTVISSSEKKRADAMKFGAAHYLVGSDEAGRGKLRNHFGLILNTISAPHGLPGYLDLLRRDGTMVLVGVPEQPEAIHPFPLIAQRRRIAGSLIGGIKETQEMLDFCAQRGIVSDVEVIKASQINEAYERLVKGDVRYRFVIDTATI